MVTKKAKAMKKLESAFKAGPMKAEKLANRADSALEKMTKDASKTEKGVCAKAKPKKKQ